MARNFNAGQAEIGTPTSDKARGANAGQVGSNESVHLNSRADGEQAQASAADRKLIASLQAEFALRGHALDLLHDGTMLLSRWGWTRSVSSLADAQQLLARIGGRH